MKSLFIGRALRYRNTVKPSKLPSMLSVLRRVLRGICYDCTDGTTMFTRCISRCEVRINCTQWVLSIVGYAKILASFLHADKISGFSKGDKISWFLRSTADILEPFTSWTTESMIKKCTGYSIDNCVYYINNSRFLTVHRTYFGIVIQCPGCGIFTAAVLMKK